MGHQWCGVDDDEGHEQGVVLRLQEQEGDGEHVDHDEHLCEQSGAGLVLIALAGVVHDADEGQQRGPSQRHPLLLAQHGVVAQGGELCQTGEMARELVEPSLVEVVAQSQPVGSDDAQYRLYTHAPSVITILFMCLFIQTWITMKLRILVESAENLFWHVSMNKYI